MEHQAAKHSAAERALLRLATILLDGGYRFVTPTPATHRLVNARPGNEVARDVAGIFGWSRNFRPETISPDLFALAREAGALVEHDGLWRSRIRLSTLAGMGFLHSAFPTDAVDAVFFGPDTYRFAACVSAHLASLPAPRRAVDIGCGAGVGAMLIARAHPAAETILADINPTALRLAQINVALSGLMPLAAVRSDLLADVPGQFDLIVANPPYLPDRLGCLYRDGGGALGAGLSLRIVRTAIARLAPGGTLLLYTGTAILDGANPFLSEAGRLLDESGLVWQAPEIDPDVFGEELVDGPACVADRIAVICLTATKAG